VRFLIGFAAPLTTPQSIVGLPMLKTVQMAVDDLRARGLDVEVKAVDDFEDDALAVGAARELVADPAVIAMVGHKNSGPSKSAAPVYAEAGLAQVSQ